MTNEKEVLKKVDNDERFLSRTRAYILYKEGRLPICWDGRMLSSWEWWKKRGRQNHCRPRI